MVLMQAELLGQVKTTVAVKKLSSHFKENIQKLKKEIKWLYELEHENLIKLFDYHIEKDLQILVYEYMENGSLEDALTTGNVFTLLIWRKTLSFDDGSLSSLSFQVPILNIVVLPHRLQSSCY